MNDSQLIEEDEQEFTLGDLVIQKLDDYIIKYGRDPKAIVITRTGYNMLVDEIDLDSSKKIKSYKEIPVFISDEDVINI